MALPAGSDERALAELRAAVVAAGRRLGARGLISAGEGNISVRLAGERLLITPTGARKDELEPDDLVIVPLAATDRRMAGDGPRASSDVAIHRAVLQSRPDVSVVAHAHLPASMAKTLAGVAPDPAALPETALLLPRLPFLPFGTPGSEELAGRIAAALAEGPEPLPGAVLLERHGAVTVGAGDGPAALTQAIDRLELVEVLCRTWRDALLVEAAVEAIERADRPGGGLSFRRRPGSPDAEAARDPGRER